MLLLIMLGDQVDIFFTYYHYIITTTLILKYIPLILSKIYLHNSQIIFNYSNLKVGSVLLINLCEWMKRVTKKV